MATVYHNPNTVSINAVALTGVVAISVDVNLAEIHASADDDTVEAVARYGLQSTGGQIQFIDAKEAESADGLAGTLLATLVDPKGGGNKTLTIANVAVTGFSIGIVMNAAPGCTVGFIAESAPAIS